MNQFDSFSDERFSPVAFRERKIMDHDDIEQFEHRLPDGQDVFVTLCTCGQAFYDSDSQIAYGMWEDHEARY
jgi:hypothetical protein